MLAGFVSCGNNSVTDASSTDLSSTDVSSATDNEVDETALAVTALDTKVVGTVVRQRETAENTRMLINESNPLFLFRISLPVMGSRDSLTVNTYKALPEDVRNFSAMLVTGNFPTTDTLDALYDMYDSILDKTDEAGVPAFLQIEYWNSADERERFSIEQLQTLLEKHPSLKGFVHNELCCSGLSQEEVDRLKNTIRACEDYGALLIWEEMEYQWENHINTLQLAFEDEELYEMMTNYSHNIVIQDKHNGRGRHFSTQSSAMGAWLSGACGNWGSNIEAWLWYEIGNYDYANSSIQPEGENYTYRYPPAVAGIDTIADLVGGATVFSSEEISPVVTTFSGVQTTETFWTVLYPIYQEILNGAIPSKQEVVENVKVAYQFTTPTDYPMMGLESNLFIDSYGLTNQWYMLFQGGDRLAKWIPYTGRYYIIPTLSKHADASAVVPNADILNVDNYAEKTNSTANVKQEYLNSKFEETYTGDATLFTIAGRTYIFNNNEFKNGVQTANYALKTSGLNLSTELDLHAYMILKDKNDGIDIDLVNLRLDSYATVVGEEIAWSFQNSYLGGGKMDNEADFRTTKIVLSGFEKEPEIAVAGSNNATAKLEFDPDTKTVTLTIVSNGKVTIKVIK